MAYFTLIASLPHLPPHFDVPRVPITRGQLNERLQLLREDDQLVLQQLSDFLAWDRQPLDRTDIEVVTEYERLTTQIRHPLVQQIVQLRIDVRTIVGALRRRRNGDGLPVGVGRLVPTIQRRWSEPQFGLERQFPWIETFFEKMVAGEVVEAERVLYEFTWTTWCRMATQFTFSFEAVLLYLARWSIVERWTSRDVESGRARFEKMIEETLGEYAFLQF